MNHHMESSTIIEFIGRTDYIIGFIGLWQTFNWRRTPRKKTPLRVIIGQGKAGNAMDWTFICWVRLLVENGAQINAKTIPGVETGAFMRDVRTKGETPLHRAAAYADETTIKYLIDHGAEKKPKIDVFLS